MGSPAHTPNSGFACDQYTTTDTTSTKAQSHSAKTVAFGLLSPNGSALWRPHPLKSRARATTRGELHDTRARHAGDTPQEGFVSCKTPTATVVERTCGPGRPGPSAHEQQKPSNRTQGRPTSGTKLSPLTRPHRMSGTKLSQHTRPHRMCGTKLSQHTRPCRMCGTKLSPLTRNALIWRNLRMQGEFCTVLTTKKPSRENFVPNARQRSN